MESILLDVPTSEYKLVSAPSLLGSLSGVEFCRPALSRFLFCFVCLFSLSKAKILNSWLKNRELLRKP